MAKGIVITPQGANPLPANSRGLWFNSNNELIAERGPTKPAQNMTTAIEAIQSGEGVDALTRTYTNPGISPIPIYTPVYSQAAGLIAPAIGLVDAQSRVIGVTAEEIPAGGQGKVAYAGMLTGVTGFTHGAYLYLDQTAGIMTEDKPSLGTFPAGFFVVRIGLIEGNNLFLQITAVGTL